MKFVVFNILLSICILMVVFAFGQKTSVGQSEHSPSLTVSSRLTFPRIINYQGYITDLDNNPVTGSEEVLISIWDREEEGTRLWQETHSVDIVRGYFSVELGSQTVFPTDLFNGDTRWLQLSLQDEDFMPRKRIASVAYSLHAFDSAHLNGQAGDAYLLKAEATNSEKNDIDASSLGGYAANKYLTLQQLDANYIRIGMPGSVNSEMIVDNSIQRNDIGFDMGTGTISGITAESGLKGGGIEGHVSLSLSDDYFSGQAYDTRFVLQKQKDAIVESMIGKDQVTSEHIKDASLREQDMAYPVGKITNLRTTNGLIGGGRSGEIAIALDPNYQNGSAYDNRFINHDEESVITGSMIKDESLTSADIKDGSIQASDLSVNVGDIGAVNAGRGLIGGGAFGSVTLELESSYLDGSAYFDKFVKIGQLESITGAMIKDGTIDVQDIKFQVGDVTSVNVGPGLFGGGLSGDIGLQLAPEYLDGSAFSAKFVGINSAETVNSLMITDKTITALDIADGALSDKHFPNQLYINRQQSPGAVMSVKNASAAANTYAVQGDGFIGLRGQGTIAVQAEGDVFGVQAICNNPNGWALKVEGRATCSTGGWSDLAEHVYGQSDLEAGDVVIIDSEKKNSVKKSQKEYETSVAGIISTDPTITVGHLVNSNEGVPLALAGIVPCKVTTQNGAINPGDLLVSSPLPGYAMKATDPKPGTIIGKAMEPLNMGKGLINVLISLQ